ncbi:UDP-4-amino-4,6-dideoxy-N-acetyl-beta-L-altrosami ne transaminase [Oceaniserpentilla sp. 4NH20-0058]|uniref:UDP-4-amino-4, 6-dideoxy-N-acetyl-beta-L-altrosamine transaminase n=1 Tax=Oceaniserpentilla sp. 4NH20-0058 TaxID=3127660 RepID=UPI00310A348B
MIPYGRQSINDDDIAAVTEVLKSDFLTQGQQVPNFEHELSKYVDAQFSIAVNSATSALHIACLALGVGKDDYVWTSPISFVASSNCALYCGASVDFVDINPHTYNLCPNALRQKLEHHKQYDLPLPKVVIPVHFSGQVCDMSAISILAEEFDFKIIEDASHAIGATYLNKKVGSCEFSDITIFSFHPVKIITCGEGGMLTTNDKQLEKTIRMLRSHCITRESNLLHNTTDPWYYEQQGLGYNYRMTDIQAALGVSQLSRLDDFISARRNIAKQYKKTLSGLPITLPAQSSEQSSAWHLYVITLDERKRLSIFKQLREAGIGVNVHYIPIYFQPFYQSLGFKKGLCPNAEVYYQSCITLPIYPDLNNEQQIQIVQSLKNLLLKDK